MTDNLCSGKRALEDDENTDHPEGNLHKKPNSNQENQQGDKGITDGESRIMYWTESFVVIKNDTKCTKKGHILGDYDVPTYKEDFGGNFYSCFYCQQIFGGEDKAREHMGEAHNDFHFRCLGCGEKFPNYPAVVIHIQGVKFKCTKCDFSSHISGTCKSHYTRKHKDNKNPEKILKLLECLLCGYKVLKDHNLSTHMWKKHGISDPDEKNWRLVGMEQGQY